MGLEQLFSKVSSGFSRFKNALSLFSRERNVGNLKRLADGYGDFYESKTCYDNEVIPSVERLGDNVPMLLRKGLPRFKSEVDSAIEMKRQRNINNYVDCIKATMADVESGKIQNGEGSQTLSYYVGKLRSVDDGKYSRLISDAERYSEIVLRC